MIWEYPQVCWKVVFQHPGLCWFRGGYIDKQYNLSIIYEIAIYCAIRTCFNGIWCVHVVICLCLWDIDSSQWGILRWSLNGILTDIDSINHFIDIWCHGCMCTYVIDYVHTYLRPHMGQYMILTDWRRYQKFNESKLVGFQDGYINDFSTIRNLDPIIYIYYRNL